MTKASSASLFPWSVKDLEIDGGGATFVFHGGCAIPDRELAGRDAQEFLLDFSRPFHSEGRVLAVTPGSVDLEFSEEFPYAIRNGVLVFTDGKKSSGPETTVNSGEVLYPYGSLLAFDPVKRETAFMAKDRYGMGEGVVAQEIGPNQVRLTLDRFRPPRGRSRLQPENPRIPGVVISDSSGVHLSESRSTIAAAWA